MMWNFELYKNSFTSKIPTELGALSRLKLDFNLKSNSLSSGVPTELGALVAMTFDFELGSNRLVSEIPSELGNLIKMHKRFGLQDNLLSSSIPTEFGKLAHMTAPTNETDLIRLQPNFLCGTIPSEVEAISAAFLWVENTTMPACANISTSPTPAQSAHSGATIRMLRRWPDQTLLRLVELVFVDTPHRAWQHGNAVWLLFFV